MNGRCDNNPLDASENICGICGGEFCGACVIETRNRRKLVCKSCALEHSGLRSGDKSSILSRRNVKGRRRELESFAEVSTSYTGFTYFDDADSDFEFTDVGEGTDDAGFVERRKPTNASGENSGAGKRTSNRRRFGRFGGRRENDPTLETSTTVSEDIAEPESESLADSAPSTDSYTPAAPGPEHEPSAPSAAEVLDQIRQTPGTPAPAGSSETARLEATSPSAPASVASATQPPAPQAPAPQNTAPPEQPAQRQPQTAQVEATEPQFSLSEIATTRAPASEPQALTPATLPTLPADRQPYGLQARLDLTSSPFAKSAAQAATQPAVSASPVESAAPPVGPSAPVAGAPAVGDDFAVNPFGTPPAALTAPVAHAAPVAAPAPSADASADRDSDGNWIPPLLRGMAPIAEREGAPLPRRRSAD